MDKKLLQALENIGDGLEALVEALNSKEEAASSTGAALKGGDFGKQLEEINVSIKSIKADTQEILKNQQTIIALSKKKEDDKKTGEFEGASDPKKESAIKKGVATILLIAVAVLAIGMAFKLVGDVDFLSVVGLALAITLIAIAFEKVASLNISIKEAFTTSAAMVIMAAAVTASSWVLSAITPISLGQAVTGILIGVMFYFLLPAAAAMIKAMESEDEYEFNGMKVKNKGLKLSSVLAGSLVLPLIMIGVSLGIMASSHILAAVKPIGITQALTSIAIGLVFAIIAPVIGAIITGITTDQGGEGMGFGFKKKGVSIQAAVVASLAIPIIMMGMSLAILTSSYILAEVRPVGIFQLLTSIAISAVFTVLAYGLSKMISALDNVKPAQAAIIALTLPILFIALSYAMMVASDYFSQIKPIGFDQFLTALAISIIFVVLSFAVGIIAKALGNLKPAQAVVVAAISVALFVALSYALMLSSEYLSQVTPVDYGLLFNIVVMTIALSISAVVFGAAIWALSKLGFTTPGGALQFLIGAALFLVVAGTIMASSLILGLGDYKTFPSLEWTLGVGAAFLAFSISLVALGALALTGIGSVAFFVGIPLVLSLAGTIVGVSKILKMGDYNLPGILDWAIGVSLLFATFTPILLVLGAVGLASAVMDFFGPNPWEMAKDMMLQIASTIVGVSFILAKGNYKDGPTEKWAKGVAISIGAFSSVYDMLAESQSLFGGPSPDEFRTAILTVIGGIVTAANMLAKAKVAFQNAPPYKWAKGVGEAIGAFAPVYEILAANSGWFSSGVSVEDFKKAILTVSQGIVDAAEFFAKNKSPFDEGNYPSPNWGRGVGAALNAFAPVFKALSEDTGWFTSGDEVINNMVNGVTRMTMAIVKVAKILAGGKKYFNVDINPNFMRSVSRNMLDFNELVSKLREDDEGYFTWLESMTSFEGNDPILKLAGRMTALAKGYDALATSLVKLGNAMKVLDVKNNKELPFLGEDSLLRNPKKPLNPEIVMPTKKEMSKVGGDDKKAVGLRPSPKESSTDLLLKKLDTIEKGIKAIAMNSKKTSDILDQLYSSTSEYHEEQNKKKK